MANTLVGLFNSRDAAQNAVSDLINAGFSRDSVSIIANDGSGGTTTQDVDGNLAGEGAASGLGSGAVVGGVAGLLIGLGFTVLPIAGLLLAGPVAGLIAGAAAGAATGGVVGGLIGLGIPSEHAERYAEGVRRGGTLVTVHAEAGEEDRVRAILNRDGAVEIEGQSAEWNVDAYPTPTADTTFTTPSTGYAEQASAAVDWDDTSYREHFANSNLGGNYDEYQNAYGYGRDLANDPTYGGDWDANETSYRSRWEEQNPGTWEEFKSSVRHAYDKAKGAVTGNDNRASLR